MLPSEARDRVQAIPSYGLTQVYIGSTRGAYWKDVRGSSGELWPQISEPVMEALETVTVEVRDVIVRSQ